MHFNISLLCWNEVEKQMKLIFNIFYWMLGPSSPNLSALIVSALVITWFSVLMLTIFWFPRTVLTYRRTNLIERIRGAYLAELIFQIHSKINHSNWFAWKYFFLYKLVLSCGNNKKFLENMHYSTTWQFLVAVCF